MMAARFPLAKRAQKRGRRKINWEPWLERMHVVVLQGETDRRASELVARRYRNEIPQGSKHGQRTDESTARLLRKHYLDWLERQAQFEKQQAQVEAIQASTMAMLASVGVTEAKWNEVFDTPEFRRYAEMGETAKNSIARITEEIAPLAARWGVFPMRTPLGEPSTPSFDAVFKSRKRRNKSQNLDR
jgi:hypothetical protein